MPKKHEMKIPQARIDALVKRHMAGESARVLAKLAPVSVQAFYAWVKKYKQAMLDGAHPNMTPAEREARTKVEMIEAIKRLKAENKALRERVLDGIAKGVM